MLEGVSEEVRKKILDDPDLVGADSHRWEKHLVHYLDKYTQEKDKKKGDLEELEEQLRKAKVGEAKQQVVGKKKEGKATKVMVAQGHPDSDCLDFYPNNYVFSAQPGHYDGLQTTPMPSWEVILGLVGVGQEALVARRL